MTKIDLNIRETPWPSNIQKAEDREVTIKEIDLKNDPPFVVIQGNNPSPTPDEDAFWYKRYWKHKESTYRYLLQVLEVTYQDDVKWEAKAFIKSKFNVQSLGKLKLKE